MKKTRLTLFVLLMLLLIFPAVQRITGLIPEKPLKGAITLPEKPPLNLKSWFDGSFQSKFDPYLEQTVGFRASLIRINNQLAFTLFDTALANGVVIGKQNYLYEINYIKAFEGTDFVGRDSIDHQVAKAKFMQQKLAESGKHFLIVFAPGKGSFYPEYIPERYQLKHRGMTNYDYYVRRFREEGIHFIDFNRWFIQMKDSCRYPLITRAGIHWSLYGVALAVDSLVHYMEKTAGIDMVDFSWDGMEVSSKPRETDNDIAEGMNVLFPVRSGPLAYPRLRFNDPPEKARPNVLAMGDSYYWNILGSGISARLFGDNNFWYYNQEAHNPSWPAPREVKSLNILDEISRQQFVILISTDANLARFPFGFLDDYMKASLGKAQVKPEDSPQKEKRILEIIKAIRDTKDWAASIKQKAVAKGISFEEMLRLDAEWVYEQENKKK